MSRKQINVKNRLFVDPVHKSVTVNKFINHLMQSGKKSIAQKIVYGAFDKIKSKTKSDPLEVFQRALKHVAPVVEVKSRPLGGATYQIPTEVRAERATTLAMRWIIEFARKRNDKSMIARLAAELLDAADEQSSTGGSTGKGGAIKKREEVHRMAEANKAFSHYRWA